MPRILLSFLAIVLLTSCSNLTYKAENNCSARGQEELRKRTSPESEEDKKYSQLKNAELKELFHHDSIGLQQCYQQYLYEEEAHREFAVCTVLTVQKGKLTFLDIADEVNSLNDQLQRCLVKKFQAYDWEFLSQKNPLTISQPIILKLRRN